MLHAPIPEDDAERLEALRSLRVLDSPPEDGFDDIVLLAAHVCRTPMALISLVDERRQWFKARVGLDATETPRDVSFCGHAIAQRGIFVVPDARADERFADNPLVLGAPHVRSYAGAPLVSGEGHALGTLCVIDRVPRRFTAQQERALDALRRQVVSLFDLRVAHRRLEEERAVSERLLLNVLPPDAAARLKRGEFPIADAHAAATVLFADVVGFTPLAATLEPAIVVSFLNDLFSSFDEVAHRHGVEKVKTIGDEYMVSAGVPTAAPDHAVRVANAALDLATVVGRAVDPMGRPAAVRMGIAAAPSPRA